MLPGSLAAQVRGAAHRASAVGPAVSWEALRTWARGDAFDTCARKYYDIFRAEFRLRRERVEEFPLGSLTWPGRGTVIDLKRPLQRRLWRSDDDRVLSGVCIRDCTRSDADYSSPALWNLPISRNRRSLAHRGYLRRQSSGAASRSQRLVSWHCCSAGRSGCGSSAERRSYGYSWERFSWPSARRLRYSVTHGDRRRNARPVSRGTHRAATLFVRGSRFFCGPVKKACWLDYGSVIHRDAFQPSR